MDSAKRYNRLGKTGLFVSELSLGTMNFGAGGPYAPMGTVEQAGADRLVARSLEAGINLIDTSNTYSNGASEEIVRLAIRNSGVPREDVLVATKVFGTMSNKPDRPNRGGLARAHILDSARASLKRLGLDYLDLYMAHGFDPATPVEETLRAFDDLVRTGLVRYVGVSNQAAWQISRALGIARQNGLERFASVEAFYSLTDRGLEREIVPEGEGLGILAWSPLAAGLLGGKFGRDKQGGADNRRTAMPFPPVDMDRAYAVLDVLEPMAATKGASVAQLAVAWVARQPRVASVILGARRLDQLEDNLGATEIVFTPEDLKSLDEASKLPRVYPGWMVGFWSGARAGQLAGSRL